MSVLAEVFAGLGSGVLQGLGTLAKDLRTAITGAEAIPADTQGKLLEIAAQVEAIKQTADFELQKAQIAINLADAQSGSVFKGGWRPMAGWAAVVGVIVYPMVQAMLPWSFAMAGLMLGKDVSGIPVLPAIPQDVAGNLLWALLGFGGLRSFDKLKGVK